MKEQACEDINTCDTDQLSFKAYFSQWLAATSVLAPFTASAIYSYLSATSVAAASTCTGGTTGTHCGFKWTAAGVNDGSFGIGQQMSALAAVTSAMVVVPGAVVFTPVTNSTGGTSVGDPTAGIADSSDVQAVMTTPATSKDKVAAGFLTFAVMGGILGGGVFMVMDS